MTLPILDPLAIFAAAVAAFIIGFLWHGPLFGKQWITLMEIPQSKVEEMQRQGMGPMIPRMIAAIVQQIVLATVMSLLASALSINGVVPAILFAALAWFGFIATTLLNGVLWEERKMSLYLFNIVYHLVTLTAISLIVVLWR